MDLLIPTLAEPLPKSKLEKRLDDDNIRGEVKLDGERLLVHVDNGIVTPVNRSGKVTTLPSREMARAFESLDTGAWAFDGEVIGQEFYIFDMPVAGTAISPASPFEDRRRTLEEFMSRWNPGGGIHLISSFREAHEKRALMDRVLAHGGEGIMLKDIRAPYAAGLRTDRIQKVKFWKSAEVIITEIRIDGKDNANMTMLCADAPDCPHPRCDGKVFVGSISTIGKGRVEVGDVFEVKFLYVVSKADPRLYQPTIIRKRDDKAYSECTIDQLDTFYTNKTVVEVVQ